MRHMLLLAAAVFGAALFEQTSSAADSSPGQQQLAAIAGSQKYAFVVFYRDNDPASQAMANVVKSGTDARSERAAAMYINVTDPAEQGVVNRFGVSRAPMPLAISVAPNGAVTRMFRKTISDGELAKAIVSPGVAHSIKAMQDGKLVFVCTRGSAPGTVPPGIADFQQDPQFNARTAVILLNPQDPAEASFLGELEITSGTFAFLAPPGVLVGKFTESTTKDTLAAALHKAGKCCDDPKCKHNKAR